MFKRKQNDSKCFRKRWPIILIGIIIASALAGDIFVTLMDQRRIAGTNCYLCYDDNTFCVNLAYKTLPYGSKKHVLVDKNILRAYWDKNKDILAVDYSRNGKITGYYLLIKNSTEGLFSPYEPYTVLQFPTDSVLKQYLENKRLFFPEENCIEWGE